VEGWWLRAPRWAIPLVGAATFAVVSTIVRVVGGDAWQPAALQGALSGVIFGAVAGPLQLRQRDRLRARLGDVDPDRFRSARRSARRGPPPADPAARHLAAEVAAHHHDELRRNRWAPYLAAAVLGSLSVWLALEAPGFWFAVVVWVALVVGYELWTAHLRRRVALLADGPSGVR
jgi:hypothetical protein